MVGTINTQLMGVSVAISLARKEDTMATEVKLKTRSRWLPVSRRSLDKDLARLVRTQSNINANNSVKMRSLERKLSKAMKLIKELQDK